MTTKPSTQSAKIDKILENTVIVFDRIGEFNRQQVVMMEQMKQYSECITKLNATIYGNGDGKAGMQVRLNNVETAVQSMTDLIKESRGNSKWLYRLIGGSIILTLLGALFNLL